MPRPSDTYLAENVVDRFDEADMPSDALDLIQDLDRNARNWAQVAMAAGWSRDFDEDDDPCFMNEHGHHEYSYVRTWRALCEKERLATEPLEIQNHHLVTEQLAAHLLEAGEIVEPLSNGQWLWSRSDDLALTEHPLLAEAEDIATSRATPSP